MSGRHFREMPAAYECKPGEIFSTHLTRRREIVGDEMWFLIPGVGKQGGFIKETVRAAYRGPGSIAINSSSGITFKSLGPDFAEKAGQAARESCEAMSLAVEKMGES